MLQKVLLFIFIVAGLSLGSYAQQTHIFIPCNSTYGQAYYNGGIPNSNSVCGQGTKMMVIERQSFPFCRAGDPGFCEYNHPYAFVNRDARLIGVNLANYPNYYPNSQEYVVWANSWHLNGWVQCTFKIEGEQGNFRVTRENPNVDPAPYISAPTSVVKGGALTVNWNVTNYSSINAVELYLDNSTSLGVYSAKSFTLNTASWSAGNHQLTGYFTNACGVRFGPKTWSFEVYPTCAGDAIATVVANSFISANASTQITTYDGGYPQNGGYKVAKSGSYTVNLNGLTDVWSNYQLTPNAAGLYFSSNNVFMASPSVGSYRIQVQKIAGVDPNNRCPLPPDFKVFIGGNDIVFKENCRIILPDYFYTPTSKVPGITGPNDIFFKHFAIDVFSAKSIVIKPGIVLQNGAEIRIMDYVNKDISSSDPDYRRNFIEKDVYDDYGNVVAGGREYYDDLVRGTQYQYKCLTSGIVFANQMLYDEAGNPAVATLSAPIRTRSSQFTTCGDPVLPWENLDYGYKTDFIQSNVTGTAYTYNHFDGAKTGNPDPLKATVPGTLGWYYSANNNASSTSLFKEPLVAQSNFPFVQNVYKTDGTNVVERIISPGDIYRSTSGLQNVGIRSVIPVTTTDEDILAYLTMRKQVFPSDPNVPLNLFEQAYKESYTDPQGIIYYSIKDSKGAVLVSVISSTPKSVSYNFYDDAGRLNVSVSPEGVNDFTGTNFSSIDKTVYQYNMLGWVLSMTEKDAGKTEFKYRKDGKLRFTQNASQKAGSPEKFSYINYDAAGRSVEGGEFAVTSGGTTFSTITKAMLETVGSSGLTGGTYTDQIITMYDGDNGAYTAPFTQKFARGKISCSNKKNESTTWYNYDERGRLISSAQFLSGLGEYFTIDYNYTSAGAVREVAYQRGKPDAFHHYYEYDADSRVKKVYTGKIPPVYNNQQEITNLASLDLQATYFYYLHGPLKRVELSNDNLQGIDYVYTIEGRLKAINNPYTSADNNVAFSQDAFALSIDYYSGDYIKTANNIRSVNYSNKNYYDGNIKGMAWTQRGQATAVTGFTYDDKNQLTASQFGTVNWASNTLIPSATNDNSESSITYDLNGNILGIKRVGTSGAVLNDFTGKYNYSANGNQLMSITGYESYLYNPAGQLTEKTNAAGTSKTTFNYNVYGVITSGANISGNKIVSFGYDENNKRLKKVSYKPDGTEDFTTWYVRDAFGNEMGIYKKPAGGTLTLTEVPVYGNQRLGKYHYVNGTSNCTYELKDHLGNVRATIHRTKAVGQADILSYTDYYPYGRVITDRSLLSSYGNRNLFQGQFSERDEETQLNAFEARMYDPVTARWNAPDAHWQFHSPYSAMGNNPVVMVDKDGRIVWSAVGAVAGGAFGAGFALYDQMHEENKSFGQVQWGRVLVATGTGALAGTGLGGLPAAVGISMGSEVADQYLKDGKITSYTDIAISGGGAYLGGKIGGAFYKGGEKFGFVAMMNRFVASKSTLKVITTTSGKVFTASNGHRNALWAREAVKESLSSTFEGISTLVGKHTAKAFYDNPEMMNFHNYNMNEWFDISPPSSGSSDPLSFYRLFIYDSPADMDKLLPRKERIYFTPTE